ncbi:MAG: SRPBCC family protein, partial [Vicinamibacterales bacterium]
MVPGSDGKAAPAHVTTMELRGDREIVIARVFDQPPAVVFDAWTRPELVARWWAPASHGVTVRSCEADVRAGGRYRYVLRHRTGDEIAFSGTYREVTPPSRLVYTQAFEQMPAGEVVVTVTFEARDGGTHLVSREEYPSAEVRAAALASGMEHGMREAM